MGEFRKRSRSTGGLQTGEEVVLASPTSRLHAFIKVEYWGVIGAIRVSPCIVFTERLSDLSKCSLIVTTDYSILGDPPTIHGDAALQLRISGAVTH